ncbi:hypothetical protein GGQ74_001850 [Desulfobaculum xiamenense]|uniref:Radical SAM core domain-containing protein n=1 Tax=Desulfobaculum xiamenense TaxID=995050 RepID=A0A846QLV9_9BACT|nr:TIGR01212 family radical SAM protein [Desulfobaculum xiamenense]NJB68177.1 hypothetical protein [Desulfobaculum xiamenense]
MNRYHGLSAHLHRRFGTRIRKIPLDAGFTCPNRDGTLSRRGCAFCNGQGSGTGLHADGMDIEGQWNRWRAQLGAKHHTDRFIAYLQSFSNTYGPIERLERVLSRITSLPGAVGLCIGTRPDCLDDDKLDLLAALPLPEVWLDLGLQSSNDDTLRRINRGHDSAAFARATHAAADRGLAVCAHIIMGLPGEGPHDFLRSARFVNALPVRGVKLHNLYVCTGTPMERMFKEENYCPPSLNTYIQSVIGALELLRPEIVIHRLAADPAPGELVAPDWAADKREIHNAINRALAAADTWQSRALAPHAPIPTIFDPTIPHPEDVAP